MHIGDLRTRLRALGALPVHEDRVLRRWATAQPQEGGRRQLQHFLPLALRTELPALVDELAGLAQLHSQHAGEDGSARLLIALRNIVGNAIQHTPERGTVRVVTEVVEHDGKPWVEMRVIDEGQGFRGDVAAQAAEPFYTRRRGGTGLGLAIASRAIEEAGGRLTFDNTPAGSGQVRILLPRHHG